MVPGASSPPLFFMARIIKLAVLTAILILLLFPIYWTVITSVQTTRVSIKMPPSLIPREITLENYKELLNYPLLRWGLNSLLVAGLTSFLSVFVSTIAAYSLHYIPSRAKNILLTLFIFSMMIPGMLTFIPLYVIVRRLGLVNTRAGMILPFLFNAPLIYFIIQYLKTVPRELIDVAIIDGCNHLQRYYYVILPLVKPGAVAFWILGFMGAWMNFFWQSVAGRKENVMTIIVGVGQVIKEISGQWMGSFPNYGVQMAGAVASFLPVMLVFIFAQRSLRGTIYFGAYK